MVEEHNLFGQYYLKSIGNIQPIFLWQMNINFYTIVKDKNVIDFS